MSKPRRVVVTGMGMVSPMGNDVKSNWDGIVSGASGISTVESFDTTEYATKFGGQLKNFSSEGIVDPSDVRKVDAFIVYALVAADEAVKDAGIDTNYPNPERISTYVGSGIGGLYTIYQTSNVLTSRGPKRVSPFFVPGNIINMAAGMISIKYGFTGPSIAIATACTTGTHSIGMGYRSILYGDCDIAVTGGCEGMVSEISLAGFMSVRALSKRNDEPQQASRPWDKDRDGFVLSEGAGILVLEEYEHAKQRSAPIYAEITGFGMSSDAYHMTSPPPDGAGAALAIQNALNDAELNPEDIQYINAHSTSTYVGDLSEVRAIKKVFGSACDKLAISSTKSMTGHLLGAAGAVEGIYSTLAAQKGIMPPTINLDNPDEECDLDFVPHQAREAKITHSLSNSFGFGGTNASLILSRI
ncbi:MAG: beta-ketoacyl-ACP synthase II [Gammaproteobacteria bacterium]|nr:beta-ketoacyl-ACP synthase II [Gammaproteobacteria bacterium]